MTLDDLERVKRHFAEIEKYFGANQKNLKEDRHKLSAAKCFQSSEVASYKCSQNKIAPQTIIA